MRSIQRQTFKDFEHIVVDGASADSTLTIAREMASENLRLLSERDSGLYDAMNKGLSMARGRYVLFLNAGDAFHTVDTLQAYADAALTDADIIYGDTVIVDSSRTLIGPRHLSAPEVLDFESFSRGMLVCHQAFMVRRDLAPWYDLRYRFSADYDWTVKCIRASSPERNVNLHRVTIEYLSDGITDRNKKKSLRERFDIMSKHYGTAKAIMRHLGFIPRALKRRISK